MYRDPPEVDLTRPAPREEMVVEPLLATVRREAPVEELTVKTLSVGLVDVPCTTKVAVGVVEPMPTLWLLVTLNTETPVEEETLNMSLAPTVPWMLKPIVEEVAFMPITVPSSMSLPLPKAVADVHMALRPTLPLPVTVPWNWSVEVMVIWPAVEVFMVMLEPLIKVMGAYLTPLLSAPRIWPCWVGALLVPVPPLATARTPLTSLLPKAMAPLNNEPPDVERTGRAEVKEEMVVEPLAAMTNREVPVEEEMVKRLEEPATPWMVTVEEVEVVPIESLMLVLSQLNN